MILRRIAGQGGVSLALREGGRPDGRPLILLHGWAQAGLCWEKQRLGALAERFRLILPDLRGHGVSEKPAERAAYDNSVPWAGDVAAIIAALDLVRPVLVGWSMGGWVVGDYLRAEGDGALGGIVLVGAACRIGDRADPALRGRLRPEVTDPALLSDDPARAIPATIAFLRACTAAPLSKRDLALMTGYNMLCPPAVRRACLARDEDWREDFGRLRVPALLIQGEAERVCPRLAFEEARAAMPGAEAKLYPGAGHAPFWEQPARFDADLAAFADGVD